MKKFLSIFLSVLMLMLTVAVIPVSAADGAISSLQAEVVAGNDKTSVNWWYNSQDKKYYLFLPSDADLSNLTINVTGTDSFTVGGKTVQSGEATDVFALGGTFSVTVGGSSYTLVVMKSANLPSVYIQTESGSLDYIHKNKNNKEAGTITVVENGQVTIDNSTLKSIKGRGNSTWSAPKKPYNIKFDEKTDLFGMGKAKKWSLLANCYDTSLIRNILTYGMALELGLPYSSEYQPVDLYVNGDYLGNYLICESIEIGKTRVNINNLEDANVDANPDIDIEKCAPAGNGANDTVQSAKVKGSRKWVNIPNDPQDITGGYLLEMEFTSRLNDEISGFTTIAGQSVTVKSPEYASKAEVNYIADYWQEAENAVYSESGYNGLGKHYTDYFDMDSLTKIYILQEFTKCLDVGQSSCYFFKDAGSDKIYAGPAWDFDHSLAEPSSIRLGYQLYDPATWWANCAYYSRTILDNNELPVIFAALYKHEDFRQAVSEKWNEVSSIFGNSKAAQTKDIANMMSASAVMDSIRWNHLSGQNADAKLNSYISATNNIVNYIPARTAALNKGFASNSAMLYYDANGGNGYIFHDEIVSVGEAVTLKAISFGPGITAPSGSSFIGWNTKADGSGEMYDAGQKIIVNAKTTKLYAQWSTGTGTGSSSRNFFQRIADFFKRIWNAFISLFK